MIGTLVMFVSLQQVLVIVGHDRHFSKISIDFIVRWLSLPMISTSACISVEGEC